MKLHLRIRTVEWQVSERYFGCIADDTFATEAGFELQEVRGSPYIETHFVELQKTFEQRVEIKTSDPDTFSIWETR